MEKKEIIEDIFYQDEDNYLRLRHDIGTAVFWLEDDDSSILLNDKDMNKLEKAVNYMRLSKKNFLLEKQL